MRPADPVPATDQRVYRANHESRRNNLRTAGGHAPCDARVRDPLWMVLLGAPRLPSVERASTKQPVDGLA
jgi:hypothetical protein